MRGSGSFGRDSDFTVQVPQHRMLFDVRELVEQAAGQAGQVSPQLDVHFPALNARGSYVHGVAVAGDQAPMERNLVSGNFRLKNR